MINKLFALCSIALLATAATVAHADSIGDTETFVGSQSGECCFNVTLDQVSLTDVKVTVSLTDGATYFAHTGSHLGFAFDLDTTGATFANIDSPWASNAGHEGSFSQNGGYGNFNYAVTNPGNGTNIDNGGPLTFDLIDASGISFSDFKKNNDGYYFVADFLGNHSTGESGINCDGTITHNDTPPPATPEPSSLMLLGTGILGAAGLMRRRMIPAATRS